MTSILHEQSPLARRRRIVEAMGLGPLWTLRSAARGSSPPPVSDDDRVAAIAAMDRETLVAAVTACRACGLSESRTHAVFGEGPDRAHWLVVGDAPSRDDDEAATPLTGQPGRLLDAMLAAVDLSRQENVFVTTAVKCRPPQDRAPLPDEIATCRPYLDRQIALLSPRLLLAIGGTASQAVEASPVDAPVVVSGEHGLATVGTHHPARLLVEPHLKAETWRDLCAARAM